MPKYDVRCPDHGVQETFATTAAARAGLTCPNCGRPSPQHFSPRALPGARVDAAADIRAYDPDPRARGVNMGLGVRTSEASSNAACREIAKRRGLTPADSGAYRPLPR